MFARIVTAVASLGLLICTPPLFQRTLSNVLLRRYVVRWLAWLVYLARLLLDWLNSLG